MKPTLYIETTIPSYLAARPSRDLVVAGHQQISREWWDRRREAFELRTSEVVLVEGARGDPALASARKALLAGIPILALTVDVERLAERYFTHLGLPARARGDAAHLALSAAYGVDYLMTWNCAHIANAAVRRRLRKLNAKLGLSTPTICTPEELMEELR